MNKLISLSLLLWAATVCLSCKDDDPEVSASIIGRWKGDQMNAKVTNSGVTFYEENDDVFDTTLEFKEDGTVEFTKDGTTTEGTYQLNGTKLTTNVDLQFDEVDLTEATFDVRELTDKKLRLHLEDDREVSLPDFGTVTATLNVDLAFDRL